MDDPSGEMPAFVLTIYDASNTLLFSLNIAGSGSPNDTDFLVNIESYESVHMTFGVVHLITIDASDPLTLKIYIDGALVVTSPTTPLTTAATAAQISLNNTGVSGRIWLSSLQIAQTP